jgi:hypothetical protein
MNITDFILWIMAVVTFVLGYWLGKSSKPLEDVKQVLSHIRYKADEVAKDIRYRDIKPGVVNRPSAQQLYDAANPKIAEEKEAIRETMQQGIEPLTPPSRT